MAEIVTAPVTLPSIASHTTNHSTSNARMIQLHLHVLPKRVIYTDSFCAISIVYSLMCLNTLRALLHLRQPSNSDIPRVLRIHRHPKRDTHLQRHARCDDLSEWQHLNDIRDRKEESLDQRVRHRLSGNPATRGLHLDRAR
jgi:hypothetical protein